MGLAADHVGKLSGWEGMEMEPNYIGANGRIDAMAAASNNIGYVAICPTSKLSVGDSMLAICKTTELLHAPCR